MALQPMQGSIRRLDTRAVHRTSKQVSHIKWSRVFDQSSGAHLLDVSWVRGEGGQSVFGMVRRPLGDPGAGDRLRRRAVSAEINRTLSCVVRLDELHVLLRGCIYMRGCKRSTKGQRSRLSFVLWNAGLKRMARATFNMLTDPLHTACHVETQHAKFQTMTRSPMHPMPSPSISPSGTFPIPHPCLNVFRIKYSNLLVTAKTPQNNCDSPIRSRLL
jgi:hypothetical protein